MQKSTFGRSRRKDLISIFEVKAHETEMYRQEREFNEFFTFLSSKPTAPINA